MTGNRKPPKKDYDSAAFDPAAETFLEPTHAILSAAQFTCAAYAVGETFAAQCADAVASMQTLGLPLRRLRGGEDAQADA